MYFARTNNRNTISGIGWDVGHMEVACAVFESVTQSVIFGSGMFLQSSCVEDLVSNAAMLRSDWIMRTLTSSED